MGAAGKFTCDQCHKSYSWKPELAGRRVKCKCGHALSVPRDDPAVADDDALPPEFEDLYALSAGAPVDESASPPPPPPPAGGRACPACGAGVDAGAVLCVNCGHNLKTGKKLKTANVAAAPEYRSYGVKGGGGEEMSPQKKKVIALSIIGGLVAIIGTVIALVVASRPAAREREARLNSRPAKLEKIITASENAGGLTEAMKDGSLAEALHDPTRESIEATIARNKEVYHLNVRGQTLPGQKGPEAKAWIDGGPKNYLQGHDHDQSVKIIHDAYDLGITDVHLTSPAIEGPNSAFFIDGIVGTLPKDPAKRKKVFTWYEGLDKTIEHRDYVHQTERGQDYIFVEFRE
jgi:hypothetical protein